MEKIGNQNSKSNQHIDPKKTGDSVKNKIITQIQDQFDVLLDTLQIYDIKLSQNDAKSETNILSDKFIQNYVNQKEVDTIASLYKLNSRYQIYINQYAFYLMKKQMIFQQLCTIIAKHNIFMQYGVYPLSRSWQLETPFKKTFQKQEYFLTPGQSAYLAFSILQIEKSSSEDLAKTVNINNDALINKIISECNDAHSKNNLIINFHPLQNFVSLIIKYPEIVFLLGQRLKNMTQRIGMYYGFILVYNNIILNTKGITNNYVNLESQQQQLYDITLPTSVSMIHTPFIRLIYFAILKQLLTNDTDIINWVEGYHYYPYKSNISKYALYDLLVTIGSQQQVISWVQLVFKRFIQNMYNEKVFDLFKIIFNTNNNVVQYIQPFLQKMINEILNSLDQLPDIVKTVFTITKIVISNVVLNIASIMQTNDSSNTMIGQLIAQYPQIHEIIDQKDERMTAKRIKLLIQYMFKQFFGQFIFGVIIRQGLNNLTAFGLLEVEQLKIPDIDTFYSNISFLGDLLYHSFMYRMDKHRIFFSQFLQSKDNPQSGVKTQQLSEQQQHIFKQFLRDMKVFYDDIANPQYNRINYNTVTYNINSGSIRKILTQEEFNLETLMSVSGLWATNVTFLQFLVQKFKENKDYLTSNFEILDKNCQHLIQNVYQVSDFDSESTIEQLFVTASKVSLFSLLKIKIQQVQEITTDEKVRQFSNSVHDKTSNGNGIVIVPFFNDILRQKKQFESITRHSIVHDEIQQALKQLQNKNQNIDDAKSEVRQNTNNNQQICNVSNIISKFKQLIKDVEGVFYTNEESFYKQISDCQQRKNELIAEADELIKDINEKYSSFQSLKKIQQNIQELENVLDDMILNISDKQLSQSQKIQEQQENAFGRDEQDDQFTVPARQQLLKYKKRITDLVHRINAQYKTQNEETLSTAYMKNSIIYKLFQKPLPIIHSISSDIYKQLFPDLGPALKIEECESLSHSELSC